MTKISLYRFIYIYTYVYRFRSKVPHLLALNLRYNIYIIYFNNKRL